MLPQDCGVEGACHGLGGFVGLGFKGVMEFNKGLEGVDIADGDKETEDEGYNVGDRHIHKDDSQGFTVHSQELPQPPLLHLW